MHGQRCPRSGSDATFSGELAEVKACSVSFELGTERLLAELVVEPKLILNWQELVRVAGPFVRIERVRWKGRCTHVVS
jgi:hypothetical protein